MDIFERLEEKFKEANKIKSVNVSPPKHYKRYGTKRPEKKFDKNYEALLWRDDI